MSDKEALDFFSPYLKKINSSFQLPASSFHLFKAPFAQPIFDKTFLKNMPTFKTPVENFYIANLDMTYPHDRGTNYAVKLGREIADLISDINLLRL
jgi:protoporphyrinogen oxidase